MECRRNQQKNTRAIHRIPFLVAPFTVIMWMTVKPPAGSSPVESAGRHRPAGRPLRRPPGRSDQGGPDMGSQAPGPASQPPGHPMTSAGEAEPAAPVPVAVLARTSTLYLQDPLSSLQRQFRSAEEWLPPGWYIAAYYWDVESGGIDLEDRSQGRAHEQFTAAGLPRDGGMAEMLAEAAGPEPRFAAVVCEDIERSGRDTFNALKLERELSDKGVPLFATDEPADIQGINPTTVLVVLC